MAEAHICRHIIRAFENMKDNNENTCRVNQALYLRIVIDCIVHKIGYEDGKS